MSNNKNNPRSLDGAETIEADVINIFEKLEVNGELGNAKQLLRVNEDADAIEWNNLENLTFTGSAGGVVYNGTISRTINIPETLTAALPITISSNEISFNTTSGTNKVAISTDTGKRVLEIGLDSSTHYIKLQENNGLIMCSLIDVKGNVNVLDNGGITFYSDAGSTPFIEISKTHILPTANMPTYAIGNATHPIHTINCRELTSQNVSIFSGGIKQSTSGATFSITSLGTGDFTAINVSGNVNANGNIVGDGNTNLSGINVANMGSLTLSGNINANGNIVGDGDTAISGIDTISLVDANSYIDTNGGYIDMSGGNISMNSGDILGCNLLEMSGDIDMNGNNINELTDISYNDAASTFSGGSASNKVVFTNCDFSNANNTHPTDLNSMGTIAFGSYAGTRSISGHSSTQKVVFTNCDFSSATNTASAVPSTITGNKTFNGDVIFQGNIELGNSDSDIIEQIGVYKDFKTYSATSHFTENIDHQKKYFGESVSNVYTYKTNILNGTHFAPYGSHRLSQSNTKSGGFPYRSKKLFPTDFMANDDGMPSPSFPSIVDSGTFSTSGFSANGAIKINSTSLELWTYFDVPEGMSLESVYLRVFDSMGQRLARNVKVFKKPMGLLGGDQRHQIKLIDANTIAAATTLAADWLGNEVGSGLNSMYGEVFYEQDCINEYDSGMAVRVELTSTSDYLMGGYALFRPNESLDYSITLSVGVMFHSSFTINFNGINGVVSHTFTGSGQSAVITLPYDYAMTRNSSQGSVLQVVGGSGRTYSFSALTNGSFDSVFERLDTPTTSTTFSAPSGTMNTHLIKYRQEISFSINQS